MNTHTSVHAIAKRRFFSTLIFVVFSVTLFITHTSAAIPPTINYHSRLRDAAGDPVTTATSISFALYTASSGGSAVWSESYNQLSGSCAKITPDTEGYFSLELGSCTAITSVDFNNPVYLGVTIGTDPEATPRVKFNPAPYALNAKQVNGISANTSATANQLLALDGSLNFNINTGAFTGDSINLGSVSKSAAQPLITLQNAAGDFQFFQTATSPVGVLTGSIGDIAVDSTNGNLYFKSSGTSSTAGWSVVMNTANINANTAISVNSAGNGLYSRGLSGTGGTSSYSNFFGVNAGNGATNVDYSNFFGSGAGQNATSASNSNFIGQQAGYGATNASYSNFFGNVAGRNATDASYSNLFGSYAGQNAANASYSNFIGATAGLGATNASHSNFIGSGTGVDATNASYSNFFGYYVGKSFTSNNLGSNNIIIGTNISLPNAAANSINIGGVLFGTNTYGTTTGNPSITPASGGRIGIGIVSPTVPLDVNGNTRILDGDLNIVSSNPLAGGRSINFGSTINPILGSINYDFDAIGFEFRTNGQVLSFDSLGNLGVGYGVSGGYHTLDVNGNIGLIANGYFNWGLEDGSIGYGFRDNGGTIEYKNNGGSWAAFGTGSSSQWTDTASGLSYAGKGLDTGWSNDASLLTLSGTTDFGSGESTDEVFHIFHNGSSDSYGVLDDGSGTQYQFKKTYSSNDGSFGFRAVYNFGTGFAVRDVLTADSVSTLFSGTVADDNGNPITAQTLSIGPSGEFELTGKQNFGGGIVNANDTLSITSAGTFYNFGVMDCGDNSACSYQKFYSATNGAFTFTSANNYGNGLASNDIFRGDSNGSFTFYGIRNDGGNPNQYQTMNISNDGSLELSVNGDYGNGSYQGNSLAISNEGVLSLYGWIDDGDGNASQNQTLSITNYGTTSLYRTYRSGDSSWYYNSTGATQTFNVAGVINSLGNVSAQYVDINYGNPGYVNDGHSYAYRIYAYKNTTEGRIYSDSYQLVSVSDNGNNNDTFQNYIYWDAAMDADGYRILRDIDNAGTWDYGYDTTNTEVTDDNCSNPTSSACFSNSASRVTVRATIDSSANTLFTMNGNTRVTGTGIAITGLGASVQAPTNLVATQTCAEGCNYTASNYQFNYRVYAYKNTPTGRAYSPTYLTLPSNFVDDNSSNGYDITVSWTAAPGADGYRILRYSDPTFLDENYNNGFDTTSTSFVDDGCGSVCFDPSGTAIDIAPVGNSEAYLNFGQTIGSLGYGFRDNAGTLEYRNSGGTWVSFGGGGGSGALNYVGTSYVGQTSGPGSNGTSQASGGDGYNILIGDAAGDNVTGTIDYSNLFGFNAGNGAENIQNSNLFGQNVGLNSAGSISNSTLFGASAGQNSLNLIDVNFFGLQAGYGASGDGTSLSANFFGKQAGYQSTDAYNLNFFGYQAGYQFSSASNANFFGYQAGYQATGASDSNFFGYQAGYQATAANNSNFFGSQAGYGATYAARSVFIGTNAGYQSSQTDPLGYYDVGLLTNEFESVFIGYKSGEFSMAPRSVLLGTEAGQGSDSNYMFAVGYQAGAYSLSENSNFIGQGAGYGAHTSSSNFIGNSAGHSATNANNSNFIGNSAGHSATNANTSNFIGQQAGQNATNASYSNFFGNVAGNNATNAYQSNFIGQNAGQDASGAYISNFIGRFAGNGAGAANTSNFIGNSAGQNAINASNSNFIGNSAGYGATNASFSNLFGYRSGMSFTSNNLGSNNIIIGTNISLPDATANALNIGGVLFGTGTYSTTTGNPSITAVSGGKIGIGVVTPAYTLDVGSSSVTGIVAQFTNSTGSCQINPTSSSVNCSSDINLKKNITTLGWGDPFELNTSIELADDTILTKLMTLTSVQYNWNTESDTDPKHTGFIAQQVEQLFPDLVSTDATTGLKSVNYMGFAPYLTKVIQEMDIKVEDIRNLPGVDEQPTFADTLIAWLSNAGNRITRIFTGEVCLTDADGTSECLNKSELHQLKQLLNQGSGGDSTPSAPDPAPEPPQPDPVPEVTPEPDQNVSNDGENKDQESSETPSVEETPVTE